MKTPLLYGSLMALVGALTTFGLYFAGLHDTPEKLQTAQYISMAVGITGAVVFLALAMREKRSECPPEKTWGYGSALGTGILAGIVGSLLGAVLTYIYAGIVNGQFSDVLYQMQVMKMEAKGLSSSQIENASGVMRKMMSPVAITIFSFINGVVGSVIFSLIVAIFFRNRPAGVVEMEAVPPPVA